MVVARAMAFLVGVFAGVLAFYNPVFCAELLAVCILLGLAYWGLFYAAQFKKIRIIIGWLVSGIVAGLMITVVRLLEPWEFWGIVLGVILDLVLLMAIFNVFAWIDRRFRAWRGLPEKPDDSLQPIPILPFALDGHGTWQAQGGLSRSELLAFSPFEIRANVTPQDFDNRSGSWDYVVVSSTSSPDDEMLTLEMKLNTGKTVITMGYGLEQIDPLMQVVAKDSKIVCSGSLAHAQNFILERAKQYRAGSRTSQPESCDMWEYRVSRYSVAHQPVDGALALRFAPVTIYATFGTFNPDDIYTFDRLEPTEVNDQNERVALVGQHFQDARTGTILSLKPNSPAEVWKGWRDSSKKPLCTAKTVREAEVFVLGLFADKRLSRMNTEDDTGGTWSRHETKWEILNASPIKVSSSWRDHENYLSKYIRWTQDGYLQNHQEYLPNEFQLWLEGPLIKFSTLEETEAFMLERYRVFHDLSYSRIENL